MLKKLIVIALTAAMAISVVGCSCGGSDPSASAVSATEAKADDEAKVEEIDAEKATEAETKPTEPESKEEKAVKDNKLKVDKDGNVVDENGNKLEVDEDGNVTVKTDDGQTVKVSTSTIKAVNNTNNSSKTSSNNTSSKNTSSKNNSTSNTDSKPSTSTSNTSSTSSKPSTGGTSSNSGSKPSTGNTNTSSSSKTWHEAVYEYIEHKAETKQVWVVDQEAYTYEEPIYETQSRTICNDCGADITGFAVDHAGEHLATGGKGSYHNEHIQVQVGTETITVPEEGHYETQVVKEAWTEKVLVKEAGWY